ncbi:MAG: hypothetical protein ACOWWM_03455 [Desulfobacterales bacterium]
MLVRRDTIPQEHEPPGLETYRHPFCLDRIRHGVDNLHYDLRLSPTLTEATRRMIIQLVSKMSGVVELPGLDPRFNWQQEEKRFVELLRTVLEDAVNRAKFDNEPQVLYLAVAAVAALYKEGVHDRYNTCLQHVKHRIWRSEVNYNHETAVRLQEDLLNLTRNRERIFNLIHRSLYRYLADALSGGANDLYAIHFGPGVLLPETFFDNPLLHEENPLQDAFLIREYFLIGHRREDIHQYEAFLAAIKSVVRELAATPDEAELTTPEIAFQNTDGNASETAAASATSTSSQEADLDGWIKCESNMDALFNFLEMTEEIRRQRWLLAGRGGMGRLRQAIGIRRQRMELLQKEFQRRDLMRIVLAMQEIGALCEFYAPPLTPHEILRYLVDRNSRRRIRDKLKRIKKSYGEPINLTPMRETITRLRRMRRPERQRRLLDFVRTLSRYHCHRSDFDLIQEAMGKLHFPADEKDLELSRANGSLYEFLLPNEHGSDDAPVVGHVILKSDVRGSTGIVSRMKNKGLNPATNFSMNFFDPISEILLRYGAQKVFIEGDAIILAILERENRPDQWYCVSRACGLAMAILLIVRRYNRKNQQSDLPHLEVGIGISYSASAPTYFFDDEIPIMISPAINRSDRLSSCFKSIRQRFSTLKPPFNVYVFEPVPEDRPLVTEPMVRYNVGGIEIDPEGFEKLKREIQLKRMEFHLKSLQKDPITVYAGSFPTQSGATQSLIIREAPVHMISLKDMKVRGRSGSRYYEVCTHPAVYQAVKARLK